MNKQEALISRLINKQASEEEVRTLMFMLNHTDLAEWQEAWDQADNEVDPKTEDKMLYEIRKKIQKNRQIALTQIWHKIAICLIVVLSTSTTYFYLRSTDKNPYTDTVLSVDKGQKAEATLPDGTKVWLNSDTRLTYGKRFNINERTIHLIGEAYFEVAKNPDAPFTVQTSDLSIKALGTAFNVKAYENESTSTAVLIEGQVEVSTSTEKVILKPDERIDYDKQKASITKTETTDGKDFVAWKNNQFVFHDQYLEDIIHTLSRHYNITFAFEDASIKKFRFSGTIANTSLESILQIFSLTSPLAYEMKDSMILLKENQQTKTYYSELTNP